MKGLTVKQQEILDFVDRFMRHEGMAPTVYEIADYFKIKSATAFAHLRALQRKGYVNRSSKARSLTLVRASDSPRHMSLTLSIPLLGRISAGLPLLAEEQIEGHMHFDPKLLPPLYIAYDPLRAEISGVYHRRLRVLFEEHNRKILAAMTEFADLAQRSYETLMAGDLATLPALINANFDLRNRVFHVAPENYRMVMQARSTGASAKFAGSGGAIIGTYEDDVMYRRLVDVMATINCRVLRPTVVPPAEEVA